MVGFGAVGITVRDAREEEAGEIGRLLYEAYRQYDPGPDAPMRAEWDAYFEEVRDAASRFEVSEQMIAEDDGRLIGSVTFYSPGREAEYPSATLPWPKDWAGIRLLGVPPEARGKGIGRLLTDECIRRARAQGAVAVGLHTTFLMEVARAMYERMGFVRVPEYDFYPAPDFVVMAYRLDL